MPYHYYVTINKSKFSKFIFTVVALFYCQLNYSQSDAYTIEESNYIHVDSPKTEEKGLPNSKQASSLELPKLST